MVGGREQACESAEQGETVRGSVEAILRGSGRWPCMVV